MGFPTGLSALAGCPRFASVLWTLTWAEEHTRFSGGFLNRVPYTRISISTTPRGHCLQTPADGSSAASLDQMVNYVLLAKFLVGVLAVERLVEANLLRHLVNFHRGEGIDDAQHSIGEDERPDG